jgi:hypothetical protein
MHVTGEDAIRHLFSRGATRPAPHVALCSLHLSLLRGPLSAPLSAPSQSFFSPAARSSRGIIQTRALSPQALIIIVIIIIMFWRHLKLLHNPKSPLAHYQCSLTTSVRGASIVLFHIPVPHIEIRRSVNRFALFILFPRTTDKNTRKRRLLYFILLLFSRTTYRNMRKRQLFILF